MKILWFSNAPWCPTGYGNQTSLVVPKLVEDGHDVAIAANYGLAGQHTRWNGVKVFPQGWDMWSNDILPAHADEWFDGDEKAWVITLFDVWALRNPLLQRLNIAAWCPVDHLPTPPRVARWFTDHNAVPIAMAEYGQRMLAAERLDPLYAPHSIDTSVYRPTGEVDGVDVRRDVMRVDPGTFVVGMVANNKGRFPCRKAFPEAFLAFSRFHQDHPNSVLYVHSDRQGHSGGIDLASLAASCRIPEDAVRFVPQYEYRSGLPHRLMAGLYSAMDVLLAPSMGEGFGIPVIEAQACGTPVIVSDATAQSELCGAGWAVGGQPAWNPDQDAWLHSPSIEELVVALGAAEDARGELSGFAEEFAQRYDVHAVHESHWRPVIEALEGRTGTTAPIATGPLDLEHVA